MENLPKIYHERARKMLTAHGFAPHRKLGLRRAIAHALHDAYTRGKDGHKFSEHDDRQP